MATAAVAAPEQRPGEFPEWVERLRHGGPIPFSDIRQDSSPVGCSWACPPGELFFVRGDNYEDRKGKISGGECLLQPLALDFMQGSSKIERIMERSDCRVRAALDAAVTERRDGRSLQQPFVWIFNIQLCTSANHSLVLYFVSFDVPSQGSLLQRFLDGDDVFRNSRLKVLTRLPEAPKVVQVLVGERWPVCVVGKVMKCTYTRGENYLEVDLDVGSSPLIRSVVQLTFGLSRLIVLDLAFVLEGIYPDELPERVLGAFRFHKLDPSSTTHAEMPAASVPPETNTKAKITNKWRSWVQRPTTRKAE